MIEIYENYVSKINALSDLVTEQEYHTRNNNKSKSAYGVNEDTLKCFSEAKPLSLEILSVSEILGLRDSEDTQKVLSLCTSIVERIQDILLVNLIRTEYCQYSVISVTPDIRRYLEKFTYPAVCNDMYLLNLGVGSIIIKVEDSVGELKITPVKGRHEE